MFAGIEESMDYYLISLMEKKGNGKAATVSIAMLLLAIAAMLGISFIGIFRYHRRVFEHEEVKEERLRKRKAPTRSALSLCTGCVINDVPAASDPAVSVRNRIVPQKKHMLHLCRPSGSEQSLRW